MEPRNPQQRSLTPEALKAYAHPLRLEIIRYLGDHGPQTATSLAQALGESTGQTSYHLRQLAKHGLVQDDPERNKGRERWWKASSFSVDAPTLANSESDPDNPQISAPGRLMLAAMVRHRAEALHHWIDRETVPEGWEVALHHSATWPLTPDELRQLNEAVQQAMQPFLEHAQRRQRSGTHEDMTRVRIYYDAFPLLDD